MSDALADAAARAPHEPGVYFFLDGRGDIIYVGKAGDLRRRLAQHAATGPPTSHLHARYDEVRDVRWEAADEEAAAWREADLIFALRPRYNAGAEGEWRVPYLVVGEGRRGTTRFELTPEPAGTAYGGFPHLGKGMATRLGIACSDGYVAFLRLLWAASPAAGPMPAAITRSAPMEFDVALDERLKRALHGFLSGVSAGLLTTLRDAAASRPAFMQPALARDLDAAHGFFRAGPRLVRTRRLRQKLPRGPVTPEVYRSLVLAELDGLSSEHAAETR